MFWFFTLLGAAIAALGLYDVFQTLLHPHGRGRLSRGIITFNWRFSSRRRRGRGSVAGPLGVLLVFAAWVGLQALGWALIYLPHLPAGFSYTQNPGAREYSAFGEAMYFSLVTLGTLGFGDLVPADPWIRILSPLEAITGLVLLTAAISWFLQILPALATRRALAIRLSLLRDARFAERLAELDPATVTQTLQELSTETIRVRVDLTQNGETYYFRDPDRDESFAASAVYALTICANAVTSASADVRFAGEVLRAALDDLGSLLSRQFGHGTGSTEDVLASFAADYGHGE